MPCHTGKVSKSYLMQICPKTLSIPLAVLMSLMVILATQAHERETVTLSQKWHGITLVKSLKPNMSSCAMKPRLLNTALKCLICRLSAALAKGKRKGQDCGC